MTSVRVEARVRLVEMIRSAINDPTIAVYYGLPTRDLISQRSAVWVGDIEGGEQEPMMSARGCRRDNFSMQVTCASGPNATASDVVAFEEMDPQKYRAEDERVMRMVEAIDDLFATKEGRNLEGLHDGTSCHVSQINGPNPRWETEGSWSEAVVTVSFQSTHSN